MIVIAEDSVRFAHSGPSHNLLRPAFAELVSCVSTPCPCPGVDTPPQYFPSTIYKKRGLLMSKLAASVFMID